MQTAKSKAEAYVRSKIPELMELSFGCRLQNKQNGETTTFVTDKTDDYPYTVLENGRIMRQNYVDEIIGHPIKLNDWLRVLGSKIDGFESDKGELLVYGEEEGIDWDMSFSLKTGQPVDEESYKQFLTIVGE